MHFPHYSDPHLFLPSVKVESAKFLPFVLSPFLYSFLSFPPFFLLSFLVSLFSYSNSNKLYILTLYSNKYRNICLTII